MTCANPDIPPSPIQLRIILNMSQELAYSAMSKGYHIVICQVDLLVSRDESSCRWACLTLASKQSPTLANTQSIIETT